jgi:hypothetical protein
MVDYLVYATPRLDETVERLRKDWGIDLVPGGPHVGRGTRNYLAGLGNGSYLEVIGPDLDQETPRTPRPFGVDDLASEQLVTWCSRPANELSLVVQRASAAGYDMGTITAMSRRRPDGHLLEWELTIRSGRPHPVIPFCIAWGATPHPTESLTNTTTLRELSLRDPNPLAKAAVLHAIGELVDVQVGPSSSIVATLLTPNGELILD